MFDLDSALGVAISGNRLCFCAVSKGLQGFSVKSARVIENFRDLEPSELNSRVQQFTRSNGFNRENVILGLPREEVIVHTVELPLEVEENLDQVVQFQAAKLEPAEEESSYHDYVILERNEKERSILLQIVMAPKNGLDRALQLLRELNLYPVAIRVASLGLQQVLKIHRSGFGDLPTLLIDLESDSLEIVLAGGSQQCFPHKRLLKSDEELTLELILEELDLVISRLPVSVTGCRKILLTGSRAEEFLEQVADHFGDTELLRSGLKLKSGRAPDGGMHALGLALSGLNRTNYSRFNLIPKPKRLVGQRASLVPSAVLAGLFVLLLILWGMRGFFQQQALLDSLEAELQRLQPSVEEALETRRRWEEVNQRAVELHEMLSGRQRVLEVLRELTERIPEDAYLQNVLLQRDKVTITGYAQNEQASSLLTLLGSSSLVANVESRYITRERTTNSEKFNFELTLRESEDVL